MKKYQVGIILGIGIICAAGIPLLFPRATIAVSLFPNPIILSMVIALAGIIVLLISIMLMFKS
ncbi:MAG: hypothetical protein ACW98Y_11780 [Candidatus Thorarchaeota archaeon]